MEDSPRFLGISRVASELSDQASCPVCLCVPMWEVPKHMTVTATEGLLGVSSRID